MALTFGAATTDSVDVASDVSIEDLDPYTWWGWFFPTAFTNTRRFLGRGDELHRLSVQGTDNIRYRRNRASNTTNTVYETNDSPLSLNVWHFVAASFNSGASAGNIAHIYVGTLTTLAVESAYGTQTDGAGTPDTDVGSIWIVGNKGNKAKSFEGDIAIAGLIDRELTLGQIQDLQFRPRAVKDTKIFIHLGHNGTGTQPDWSGNGNSGTVSGPTAADHVPLGPPFGFDLGWEGNFAAAAGAFSLLPPPHGMRHMLVR